jgi:N-acetylmuramidase
MPTTLEASSESSLGASGGVALSSSTGGAQAPDTAAAAKPHKWTLPVKGAALKLAASDYASAAKTLGAEAAAVHAVSEVESGGRTGFDAHKRPKILFETHHFRVNSGGKFNASHPELTAPYSSPLRRASYNKDQWKVIHAAFALDPHAAVKSASWGMFQVLGENAKACGWKSLEQFVTDMFYSEGQHMRVFLGFCKANNLTRYLARKDWASFARGYNGASYADFAYDIKMAAAYKRYAKK